MDFKNLGCGLSYSLQMCFSICYAPGFFEDHKDWGFHLLLGFSFVLAWTWIPLILSFSFAFLLVVPLHIIFEITPLDQVLQIIFQGHVGFNGVSWTSIEVTKLVQVVS